MHSPFCYSEETRVTDSRLVAEGRQIKRRRMCVACTERFSTYETAELLMPKVIKRDGRRKPFDEENLRTGMLRALEKRPVSSEAIETAISQIKQQIRATGEREVQSHCIGDYVMDALQGLDRVAYVRFASVYRRFTDVSEFQQTIEGLDEEGNVT